MLTNYKWITKNTKNKKKPTHYEDKHIFGINIVDIFIFTLCVNLSMMQIMAWHFKDEENIDEREGLNKDGILKITLAESQELAEGINIIFIKEIKEQDGEEDLESSIPPILTRNSQCSKNTQIPIYVGEGD